VVVTDEEALALDARLGRSAQPIVDAIERLDRQRMARMADALAVALDHDLVDAQDFAAPGRRAPPGRQEL
jgi:hypothetical protein